MKVNRARAAIAVTVGWSAVSALVALAAASDSSGFQALNGEILHGFDTWLFVFVMGWSIGLAMVPLLWIFSLVCDWVFENKESN